jgi:hypothetical protein
LNWIAQLGLAGLSNFLATLSSADSATPDLSSSATPFAKESDSSDPAYQSISFIFRASEARALFSELSDDENSVPTPQGWPAWQRSNNRVVLPSCSSSGTGTVHEHHVRMKANFQSEGSFLKRHHIKSVQQNVDLLIRLLVSDRSSAVG